MDWLLPAGLSCMPSGGRLNGKETSESWHLILAGLKGEEDYCSRPVWGPGGRIIEASKTDRPETKIGSHFGGSCQNWGLASPLSFAGSGGAFLILMF